MNGKKSEQLVVRISGELLQAVKQHQARMQARRPFDRITTGAAVRDLLARAVVSAAKPSAKRR